MFLFTYIPCYLHSPICREIPHFCVCAGQSGAQSEERDYHVYSKVNSPPAWTSSIDERLGKNDAANPVS